MDGRSLNEIKIDKHTDVILATLPDFVKMWDLNLKASRTTAKTRELYITIVRDFLASISKNTKSVTPDQITEDVVLKYIISAQFKKVHGKTVRTSDGYQTTIWYVLNNLFKYLTSSGLITRNYMENIKKAKNNDLDRINENRVLLTKEDFASILKEIDEDDQGPWIRKRNKAIILLFMNTGMRKTALRTLMYDNLKLPNNALVFIDKGNKQHEYILGENVTKALKDWIDERNNSGIGNGDEHLFISLNGTELADRTVDKIVKKYTKKALGKELTPHKLRAGFCSILYNETHDIEFVRRAVGHSKAETTQRYIVTKGSEKQKVVEIMGSLS